MIAAVLTLTQIGNQSLAGTAYPCTLQWEGSADPTVAGYALYYGEAGSALTNRVDVGMATTVCVKTLRASTTYDFYVVAYDTNRLESTPSNLLPYTAAAISPIQASAFSNGVVNLSFRVAVGAGCEVDYTESLNPPVWHTLTTAVADSNGVVTVSDSVMAAPARYYRAVVP